MQEITCKQCGQSLRSQGDLQEHNEKVHGRDGGKMGGEPIVGQPPKDLLP